MWPPRFQKYHDQGFEIIGVSLDKDRKKLLDFTTENKMTWQEYFDGKNLPWENKLASRYGIANSGIPMDFLLDGNGKIIEEFARRRIATSRRQGPGEKYDAIINGAEIDLI